MTTYMLALHLLILAAIQACIAEVETVNEHVNGTEECSLPQIREAVREFNRDGDWTELKEKLGAAMNHSGEAYGQLQRKRSFSPILFGNTGSTELISLLLCAGLPANATDFTELTFLHGAANSGNVQLVRILLRHGADINAGGSAHYTPLHMAARVGHLAVVKELVQAGANTSLLDHTNHTALDNARSSMRTDVVQYLEQHPH